MYSPVDGYRRKATAVATAVATASRRQRPQCSMAAATARPMLFRKVDWWQLVRCGTVAAVAGRRSSNRVPQKRAFTKYNSCSGERAVAGPSVFKPCTAESLHSVE